MVPHSLSALFGVRRPPSRLPAKPLAPPQQWDELLDYIEAKLGEQGIRIPPPPIVLEEFVAEVERALGWRIKLWPFRQVPGRVTECAYTLLKRDRSGQIVAIVCYQLEALSGRISTHWALHEIAHLILGHKGGLDPKAAGRGFSTGGMSEEEELQAEAFASVMLAGWDTPPPPRWRDWSGLKQTAWRVSEAFG